MSIHTQYLDANDYNNYYLILKLSLLSRETKFCDFNLKMNDDSIGFIAKNVHTGIFIMF